MILVRALGAVLALVLSTSLAAAQFTGFWPAGAIQIGQGSSALPLVLNTTGCVIAGAGAMTCDASAITSGVLGLTFGGTGGNSAATARTSLGLAIGSNVQAWDADLDGVSALSTNGLATRTASNTWTTRLLSSSVSGLAWVNSDGVSGNPTLNGTVGVAGGGTGAATSGTARANLGIAGVFRATGIDCKNNATTPNSKFDLNANDVILWDTTSAGGTVLAASPGVLTNDTGVAGSTANGRDQAGAFANSTWIHFYWIWNGTTLATVSSTVAPPTGPTMPSGYTHWAYAGAVFKNSGGNLVPVRIKGASVYYDALQTAIGGGASTVEAAVSLTTFVPPNALAFTFLSVGHLITNAGGAASENVLLGHVTGSTSAAYGVYVPVASQSNAGVASSQLPNISQQVFYSWSNIAGAANVATRDLTIFLTAYRVPNGGE